MRAADFGERKSRRAPPRPAPARTCGVATRVQPRSSAPAPRQAPPPARSPHTPGRRALLDERRGPSRRMTSRLVLLRGPEEDRDPTPSRSRSLSTNLRIPPSSPLYADVFPDQIFRLGAKKTRINRLPPFLRERCFRLQWRPDARRADACGGRRRAWRRSLRRSRSYCNCASSRCDIQSERHCRAAPGPHRRIMVVWPPGSIAIAVRDGARAQLNARWLACPPACTRRSAP